MIVLLLACAPHVVETPAPPAPVDPTAPVMGLVAAPGRELVIANCTACHATTLILQTHLSREAWDGKITWMQQTQKLWPIDPESRKGILDYLEATQGPMVAAQPASQLESPWAGTTYRANPIW